jgi:hypothetical protein
MSDRFFSDCTPFLLNLQTGEKVICEDAALFDLLSTLLPNHKFAIEHSDGAPNYTGTAKLQYNAHYFGPGRVDQEGKLSCSAPICFCVIAVSLLCCAVRCGAVLCCAVLCCTVMCCAVLCCAVLCCAVYLRRNSAV